MQHTRTSGIKVRFGGTHFQCNAKSLQHFIGTHPNHVQSYDQFFRTRTHEFHGSFGFVVRIDLPRTVIQIGEFRFVHLDIVGTVFVDCLIFGQSDGPNGWVTENDGWDQIVRHFGVGPLLGTKQTIGQTSSSGNGGGGQFDFANDIPHSVDIWDCRFGIIVDCYISIVCGSYPCFGQVQSIDIGTSSRCDQYTIDVVNRLSVLQIHRFQSIGMTFDPFNAIGILVQGNPLSNHFFFEGGCQQIVQIPQHTIFTDRQMCVTSQRLQDTGEFHRNVSGTDHHRLAGQLFQFKKTVAAHGMFQYSRTLWNHRDTPHSN